MMTVADFAYDEGMARWEPDAVGRLQTAALELYDERGYDETTVAEIAARAGLTERTYFRHFADKREVLFHGGSELGDQLAAAVAAAPPELPALDVVITAVESLAPFFDERRAHSARRYRIIQATPELQERELTKNVSLVRVVAEALQQRGIAAPSAELSAEAGMAVFSHAYRRWVQDPRERPYVEHVRETLAQLRAVTGGSAGLPLASAASGSVS
jgi:AcrR family transcriptional regulator